MYSVRDTLTGGFPHSDISGSKIALISPELFAECHVLHRLSMPRHPPSALITLETCAQKKNYLAQAQEKILGCLSSGKARQAEIEHSHKNTKPCICLTRKTNLSEERLVFLLKTLACTSALCWKYSKKPIHDDKERTSTPYGIELVSYRLEHNNHGLKPWWRRTGSNRRPVACKATALPTELRPRTAVGSTKWWAWEDLNFRPHAYQARALTN